MHTRSVDPTVIEIEQSADGNGVVEGFVGPAGLPHFLHVFGEDLIGLFVDLLYKLEERFLGLRDGRSSIILEDGSYLAGIAEQFRRDRGVRANSERALVAAGGEGGNEFSHARRKRRGPAHHLMRKSREVLGRPWLEGKEIKNLGDGNPLRLHASEFRAGGAAPRAFLDVL
jgi:hypothetical protein